MSRRAYIVVGAILCVLLGLALFTWSGSQPALPSEISWALANMEPQQRVRFIQYIDATRSTLDPKLIGEPLSRRDLKAAVAFAKVKDDDSKIREDQDRALKAAVQP